MTRRTLAAFTLALAASLAAASEAGPNWEAYRYYLRGLLSERAGQRDAARADYEHALALDPTAVNVRRDLAEVLASLRRYDESLAAAERAAVEAPQDASIQILIGKIRLERREPALARKAFDRAMRLDPSNAEALFFATQSRDAGQADESLGAFHRFLESNPESAPAQWGLAELQQRLGDLNAAEASWKKVLETEPNRFEAQLGLAQIYDVRRDTEAARAAYERCRFLDPKNVAVLARLGEIYVQSDQPDRAAEAFDQAAKFGGDNDTLRFWRALLAEGRQDWARAEAEMSTAAKTSADPGVLLRLASYQNRLGKKKDVVRTLERLQRRQPDNPDFMFYLAQAHDESGQTRAAVRWFERTLQKDPSRVDASFHLGVAWDKRKNFPKAEAAMRRTIALDPRHALALNYLGYSWAERGVNLNEALDYIQRAVAEDPDNPAYLDSLGWVYFRLGRLAEAESTLSRAALQAEDPVVWQHAGDVSAKLGKTDDAVRAWQEGLLLSPRDKGLLRRLGEDGRPDAVRPKSAPRTQLKRLEGNFRQLQSWAGLVDVSLRDGRRVLDGRGLFYFQRPDRFRLEILGPFFAPQALLIRNDKDARWWTTEGETAGILLQGEERRWLDLLGQVMNGDLFRRFDDPAVTVTLAEGTVTYRATFGELQIDPARHTLLRAVIRDGGNPVHLTFSDPREEEGVTLPGRVEALDENGGRTVSLRFERGRVNGPLDATLFQPPARTPTP